MYICLSISCSCQGRNVSTPSPECVETLVAVSRMFSTVTNSCARKNVNGEVKNNVMYGCPLCVKASHVLGHKLSQGGRIGPGRR